MYCFSTSNAAGSTSRVRDRRRGDRHSRIPKAAQVAPAKSSSGCWRRKHHLAFLMMAADGGTLVVDHAGLSAERWRVAALTQELVQTAHFHVCGNAGKKKPAGGTGEVIASAPSQTTLKMKKHAL